MRMKPGPNSARERSKYAQSTMSFSSSLTLPEAPSYGQMPSGPCFHRTRANPKRVKLALARTVERVPGRTQGQPKGDRADAERSPHRVEQVTLIAVRQVLESGAEHDEARRPCLHLRDVPQLDP